MLEDYKVTVGEQLKVNWTSWLLTAGLDSMGDAFGLHDQDYIYNGKKLVNPMDSLVTVLQLGGDVACLQHLGLVYNKFTFDEHGLKIEDIDRKDI